MASIETDAALSAKIGFAPRIGSRPIHSPVIGAWAAEPDAHSVMFE